MNPPKAGLRLLGWLLCRSRITRQGLVEGGVEEVGGGGARGGEPPANREIENELAQLFNRLRRFRQRVEVLVKQLGVDPPAWDFGATSR